MEPRRFSILFERLAEATEDTAPASVEAQRVGHVSGVEIQQSELDEIAELRRIVLEITEPEPASYTTT